MNCIHGISMKAGALLGIFFFFTWKMNQWKIESQVLLLPLSCCLNKN